jgi:hypothetical protein
LARSSSPTAFTPWDNHLKILVRFKKYLSNGVNIANRTKGNFYQAIQKQNKIARDHRPSKDEWAAFLSCMNSYPGILKHYKTYKMRKKMIKENLSGWWENIFYAKGYCKFVAKRRVVTRRKRCRAPEYQTR